MLTVLIDGDILIYTMSSVNESFTQWEDDLWTLSGDAKKAALDLDEEVEAIMERVGADDYIICLTGSQNFRKGIFEGYKANRVGKSKPFLLRPLKDHVIAKHNYLLWEGVEADDIMGILATDPAKRDDYVIYSQDKDMWTLPANLWDFKEESIAVNTIGNADYHLLLQTLTGDQVDGYPGCPGVGAVTAQRALDADCSWDTVIKLFEKKGLTVEDAIIQAQLARILRHTDYDIETNSVKMWRPAQ